MKSGEGMRERAGEGRREKVGKGRREKAGKRRGKGQVWEGGRAGKENVGKWR